MTTDLSISRRSPVPALVAVSQRYYPAYVCVLWRTMGGGGQHCHNGKSSVQLHLGVVCIHLARLWRGKIDVLAEVQL